MSTNTPNTVKLVVELGPESLAKLDEVLEALKGLQGGTVTNVVNQPNADPTEDDADTDTPVIEEDEEPEYTKADVQKLVQKLAAPNNPKREKAKAIVKEYGAKISAIPVEKYPEVMRKLKKLDSATK